MRSDMAGPSDYAAWLPPAMMVPTLIGTLFGVWMKSRDMETKLDAHEKAVESSLDRILDKIEERDGKTADALAKLANNQALILERLRMMDRS